VEIYEMVTISIFCWSNVHHLDFIPTKMDATFKSLTGLTPSLTAAGKSDAFEESD